MFALLLKKLRGAHPVVISQLADALKVDGMHNVPDAKVKTRIIF